MQFPSALPHGVLSFASALSTRPGLGLTAQACGKGWLWLGGRVASASELSHHLPGPSRTTAGTKGGGEKIRSQQAGRRASRRKGWGREACKLGFWGLGSGGLLGPDRRVSKVSSGTCEVATFLRQRPATSPKPVGLDREGHRTLMSPCPCPPLRGSGGEPGSGPAARNERRGAR